MNAFYSHVPVTVRDTAARPRTLREVVFLLALTLAVASTFWAIVESESWTALLALVALQTVWTVQAVLLFHDCMHASAFSRPLANVWIARFIGGFFFWPFTFLRKSHLEHHRHAGNAERDTEALHLSREDASRYPVGHSLQWLGSCRAGLVIYAPLLQAGHFVRWASTLSLRPGRRRATLRELGGLGMDVALMAAFWVPINAWLAPRGLAAQGFVFGFLTPGLLGMVAVTWFSKPLHTGMSSRVEGDASRLERTLLTTRTFDADPLLRLLFCNLCFHIEHHLYPRVSRWELGRLARELRPQLHEVAQRNRLPLAIHRSLLRWERDFRRHGSRYNTLQTAQDVIDFNRRFESVT